jgi:hypothetical protein
VSDRPLVRASDIGLAAFCRRAWWLARVQGVQHQRPAVLEKGVARHKAHGQTVQRAQWQVRLGRVVLALGMIGGGLILLLNAIQGLFW